MYSGNKIKTVWNIMKRIM